MRQDTSVEVLMAFWLRYDYAPGGHEDQEVCGLCVGRGAKGEKGWYDMLEPEVVAMSGNNRDSDF